MGIPGQEAKAKVAIAEDYFNKGNTDAACAKLSEAFALKQRVEEYDGSLWQQNHHNFTEAMLDMAVLYYKMGNFALGDSLASRAQAWADDPNCSSQKNFERSFAIRKDKMKYFRSGATDSKQTPPAHTI